MFFILENNHVKVKSRVTISILFILLLFISIYLRLYYLQVIKSDEYYGYALKQRSKEIALASKRGTIYDRNLIPLTNSERELKLILPRTSLIGNNELYRNISSNTVLSSKDLNNMINSQESLLQIPLYRKINIPENSLDIFQVEVFNRYRRDSLLSHVIGYINKAENTGETGIEKLHDEYLHTLDKDYLIVEYDKNRSMVLGGSHYVHKDDDVNNPSGVQLTIDSKIQELVERVLNQSGLNGAVVIGEAHTGDILALASRPNFNQEEIEKYFNNDNMALYNKAIQVAYPPGSIFKIIVLLAALENNEELIKTDYYCEGYEEINGITINCSGRHGRLTLEEGFAKSCNSVFIQLGKELGSVKIIDMAKILGFGSKVNIGLLEEVAGNLPQGDELLGAAIGNISIGQGEIEVTPIQITNLLTILSNKGIKKQMYITKGITNNRGHMIKKYNKEKDERVLSVKSSEKVLSMLRDVVTEGTARGMDLHNYGGAGGKTGSAEGVLNKKSVVHGWFTGFYPSYDIKYIITIFIEDAHSGSTTAAPMFETIIKEINKIYPLY